MRGKINGVFVWFFSSILLILISGCADDDEIETKTNVIQMAALLPLSGELASKGEIRQFAIELGVENTNESWKEEGLDWQFELIVEDSQSDPEVALAKAEELWEEGYEIFIAGSSAEVEKLQAWATEKGAIVISYSSTSPTIAIEGDSVFRMVPDDTQQAKALASLLEYEGMYGIVPVYRDDVYGRELTKLITEEFSLLHGMVSEPVPYQPEETEWETIAAQVSSAIDSLEMERDRIGVVLVAFDEAAALLEHSPDTSEINEVRWFGSDTVTLSPVILNDKQIAQKASQMKLTGVTFGIPDSSLFRSLQPEFESVAGGAFLPDALFAYDIPGMLASVIQQLDEPFNTQGLRDRMIEASATYAGVTGWTYLNEKGDRKYYHYDIWEVQEENEDQYTWTQTAKFLNNPGTPAYISPLSTDSDTDSSESFLFGYEGERFDPERTLSRAEFTYMLMNAANRISTENSDYEISFVDADEIDERAKDAVAVARKRGVIEESEDGTFRPNEDISWMDAVAMVVREKGWTLVGSDSNLQEDMSKEEYSYILTAIENGFITTTGEEFTQVMREPVLLADAMLMMMEMMKGEEINEEMDS